MDMPGDPDNPIRVSVLGAGTMGTALAHVVAAVGRPCSIWSEDAAVVREINEHRRHPRFFRGTALASGLEAGTDLGESVRGAHVVIVAIGSGTFRSVAERLARVATREQLLLSATKGLDPQSHERMSELLRRLTPAQDVGAIGGANITYDIMAGHLSGLVVASPSEGARRTATRALATPRLVVEGHGDLAGVELVSALKNVAAVAVGIANGQGLAINTVSFILTKAFAEVGELVVALGGTLAPLLDVCGIGDLYLTCVHAESLNRRVGIELGKGRSLPDILRELGEPPEGVNTVRVALELARSHRLTLPVLERVHAIMHAGASPETLQAPWA